MSMWRDVSLLMFYLTHYHDYVERCESADVLFVSHIAVHKKGQATFVQLIHSVLLLFNTIIPSVFNSTMDLYAMNLQI